MRFIKDNDMNYWPTPAESPDTNPIQNLWHKLKNHLRSIVKPKVREELVKGIENFCVELTTEKRVRYIKHLKEVVPATADRHGKASRY